MKRRFTILTAAFALLTILAFPMGMWGQTDGDFEFNLNQLYQNGELVTAKTVIETTGGTLTFTDQNENFTILITRNSGNQPGFYTSSGYIRFYNSDTFKLSSAEGITITKVVVTPNGSSFNVSAMTGLNASTRTWTGSASEITFTGSGTNKWDKLTITYTTGSSSTTPTTVTIDATGITNTDVYEGSEAGSLVAIVKDENNNIITGATVSWESSNEGVATINANGEVTLVAAGTTTITANYDGDEQYSPSFNTYELEVTDSTPFTGGDVTFDATKDKGTSPLEKNGVTFACDNGVLNNGSEYRLYKNSVTTFSVSQGSITQIVFSGVSGNPASGFATQDGWTTEGNNGTWTGNSNEVSFTASGAQVRATLIVVTVDLGSIPDPSITAENISIEYNVTSGDIEYTINNAVDGGTLTANTESDWLTLGLVGETVPFTCTVNEAGTQRTATVTLTYTYNGETVTKEVTVTQGAAPVSYTTIPDLFAAATTTESPVYVTFNNWVVSGVSTNGKNVFVTDNNGNGFVIYYSSDMSETYTEGNILFGIAISCTLKLYNGFAELLNVDASNLTITAGGTVTTANVAMADLTGVNTGALLHYNNLTCSVNNNKYYLTDGTTTLQVYNALYAFDALEDGKTYNITGVYQQYNSTKEIMPRSAADIEEVVITTPSITVNPDEVDVDAEEHDGTLGLTYENLTITEMSDFDIQYYDAEGEEADEPDWVEVLVAEQDPTVGEGYVVSYYMMENDGEARTAYFKVYALDDNAEYVYSNLVTVSQDAAPAEPGTWVLTDLADLTAGDVFVIVGDNGNTYAMSNDNGTGSAPAAVAVTIVNGTISGEPAENIQWTINGNASDGYTFYPNGSNETWLYCINNNNGLRVGDGVSNVFNITDGYLYNIAQTRYIGIYNSQDWRSYTSINNNIKDQSFAFYKKVEALPDNTIVINGYGENEGGYYLIASPFTVDPAEIEGMILTGDDAENYDLYYFDQSQQDEEWQNYKQTTFNLVPGKGYLYARSTTVNLTFEGEPYDGDGIIELDYTEGVTFSGWNLVGNPFSVAAEISDDYYVMNEDGSEIIAGESDVVEPMQGVFVIAESADDFVMFDPVASTTTEGKLVMNVSRNRGNVIDRAIVRFSEGGLLPKFQLNPNNTKIYVTEGNQDFAIVRSNNEGEMPVSFKAAENGTYTINVDVENMEMDYLHLIDNMTGNDVDLLQTPSYTFEASTRDYASRFRLVYSSNENSAESNANFAYFNGNEWVINNEGDAQLQVIDMTGRIVSTETLNGTATVKVTAAPGVYMLRLVNGNDIKTQKVIIK